MTKISCNCIICAKEFNTDELKSVALSEINITRFKVCQECFEKSDHSDDYSEVKKIINSYLIFINAKTILKEAKSIVDKFKK